MERTGELPEGSNYVKPKNAEATEGCFKQGNQLWNEMDQKEPAVNKMKEKTRIVANTKQQYYQDVIQNGKDSRYHWCGPGGIDREESRSATTEKTLLGEQNLEKRSLDDGKAIKDETMGETDLIPLNYEDFQKQYSNVALDNFIRQGFRRFGHVMVGAVNDQPILGVPGMLCPRDRAAASYYGYSSFYPKDGELPIRGAFGYWYRRLA